MELMGLGAIGQVGEPSRPESEPSPEEAPTLKIFLPPSSEPHPMFILRRWLPSCSRD